MDRRVERLVPAQREERDARGGIGDRDPVCRRAGSGKPRILDVADHDTGGDVRRRDAVHDHLGAALVDVVMGRQRGEARALEPHLDVAGGFGGDVAQPQEHRPRGGDDDTRGAGADARHTLASDLARDPHAIALGRDLRRRHLERCGAVHEEGSARVALLEDDLEGGELGARRVDRDLERRGDSDELLGAQDLDRRSRQAARVPEGGAAAGGEEEGESDEEEDESSHCRDDTRRLRRSGWRSRNGALCSNPVSPRRTADAPSDDRRYVRVHVATLCGLVAVIALLLLLLWSILNHQSFELETQHRSSLEEELPSIVALTRGSLIKGNQVEVGQDGEFFDRLLTDLGGARETIHLETYLWWKGEICRRVAQTLAAKAEEGVEVRLLLDWAGTRPLEPDLMALMRDAGVEVALFHPPSPRAIGRFNARTHRKVAVIDGRIAYVFGHGIAEEWTGHGQDREHYRDTYARVRGPIVNQLQGVFFENWLEVTRKLPFGEQYFPTIEPEGDVEAHVAYVSSTGDVSAIETLYYGVIAAATREVLIQNPYVIVEGLGLELFRLAEARGVDVKVMMPSVASTDNAMVQHASHHHFEALLAAGVELYEYDRTLLHQKVIVVDRLWSTVGSANFDDRSFELNDEIQLGVVDARIARQLIAAWENDLRFAKRIDLEEWRRRGWWHRLKDRLSYTINEQL